MNIYDVLGANGSDDYVVVAQVIERNPDEAYAAARRAFDYYKYQWLRVVRSPYKLLNEDRLKLS